MIFFLKRHLGEMEEERIYKLSLASTPERCVAILTYQNTLYTLYMKILKVTFKKLPKFKFVYTFIIIVLEDKYNYCVLICEHMMIKWVTLTSFVIPCSYAD